MKIKAETVEQYHVLQYLEKHFDLSQVKVDLVDRYCVRVTDHTGESLCFVWSDNKVVVEEVSR